VEDERRRAYRSVIQNTSTQVSRANKSLVIRQKNGLPPVRKGRKKPRGGRKQCADESMWRQYRGRMSYECCANVMAGRGKDTRETLLRSCSRTAERRIHHDYIILEAK